ncbi:MAG: hypothetical protein KAH18_01195 [Psychromonas sp.]|nr:hypothetical protein [Psychromonas sp.]
MNKSKQIFELYIDYLVTSLSNATSTGFSNLQDRDVSHDQILASYFTNNLVSLTFEQM